MLVLAMQFSRAGRRSAALEGRVRKRGGARTGRREGRSLKTEQRTKPVVNSGVDLREGRPGDSLERR
jgi:hypothetical protein